MIRHLFFSLTRQLDITLAQCPAVFLLLCTLLIVGCAEKEDTVVDGLNDRSYEFHYRNLDSTRIYADSALNIATRKGYTSGRAEALNNVAFVEMAAMHYAKAKKYLDEVSELTDNQLELLIADVQLMKLCQKQSRNQDFYSFAESARRRLNRIQNEEFSLSAHEKQRLAYAQSEYCIVASAYYYYVGLSSQSIKMLRDIDPYGSIEKDTAQLLNYWYNIGAGGIITGKDSRAIAQEEFGYLVGTYELASRCGYPYWQAQALQAMSEHLQDDDLRRMLISDNYPSIVYVNTDNMPDSLLAGNLAQRALNLFISYGDVYQIAGAYRTLAECYWHIGDNSSALICLQKALGKAVNQAPDLVASIREDLCLVYSAADDKQKSDLNRNIYLDLQEQTRQDRLLEARAAQLDNSVKWLNIMIATVLFMIVLVTVLLIVFARMRRRSDSRFSISALLQPLSRWQQHSEKEAAERKDHYDEILEQTDVERLHIRQNRERNLEQRAKVQLVVSIMPLIDRMRNSVKRLISQTQSSKSDFVPTNSPQLQYVTELCDSINNYNNILTQWIQMRQGELSLHIESFKLQDVFDIVSHSSMGFTMKGITLVVKPTDAVVKADKTLTLFMVNTIADNARKFTPKGGTVTIDASRTPSSVEVSILDDGPGMSAETQSHIFDRTYTGGHGFGLKNCKGIIEKYKKISSLFNVCDIGSESPVDSMEGSGTRIFFRLPLGRARMLIAILMLALSSLLPSFSFAASPAGKGNRGGSIAAAFADSAYLSNVMGNYQATLRFADSCHKYVSPRDTAVILDISNETAVAALALHKWDLYRENNSIYTHLFREASADSSLPSYVRAMQRSKTNKTVAVVLLVMLFIIIFPAYYYLYYRHKLNYKFCVERIEKMNVILLSDIPDEQKLHGIEELSDFSNFNLTPEQKTRLRDVVGRIIDALKKNIQENTAMDTEAELAGDECRKLAMDNDRLHISNSVLDNCLSTLKHETMYYPSRIRQMITRDDVDLNAVSEVIDYYHDLYAILAEQAMRQVLPQRIDKDTVGYLFELLNGIIPGNSSDKDKKKVLPDISDAGNGYSRVIFDLPGMSLTDEQVRDLFTPNTINLDFLLVRQIVREMGEATNLRACGVSAKRNDKGEVQVNILMPKRYAEYERL